MRYLLLFRNEDTLILRKYWWREVEKIIKEGGEGSDIYIKTIAEGTEQELEEAAAEFIRNHKNNNA